MKYVKTFENTNNKKINILSGDDYEGVYIDGKLLMEAHSIDYIRLLRKLGYEIEYVYMNDEEWKKLNSDSCPPNWEDVELIRNVKNFNL